MYSVVEVPFPQACTFSYCRGAARLEPKVMGPSHGILNVLFPATEIF